MICPDCSPPRTYPSFNISSRTYLSPTLVLNVLISSALQAISKPKLLITVTTKVSSFNCPFSFNAFAQIVKMKSPLIRFPFSSTAKHLSASPSKANPTSHFSLTTYFIKASGWVDPQFSLIFVPSGVLLITWTSAPKLLKAFTATS